MTRRKRLILRTQMRSIPNRFRPNRWPRTTTCNLDDARREAGECASDEHRRKNTHPFFVAPPIGNQDQNNTKHHMRRPIAPMADVAHENFCGAILMMGNPLLNLGIEIERAGKNDSREDEKQEQTYPTLSCHSRISRLSFTWRYL